MLCKWYQWRISSLLSEKSPIPEDLQEHLNDCESCRAFYEQSRNLETLLSVSAESDPPQTHRRRLAPLLAVAAILMVAVLLSVWWNSSHKPVSAPTSHVASSVSPELPDALLTPTDWLLSFRPVVQEHMDSIEGAPVMLLAKVQDTRDYMLSYLPQLGDEQGHSSQ